MLGFERKRNRWPQNSPAEEQACEFERIAVSSKKNTTKNDGKKSMLENVDEE